MEQLECNLLFRGFTGLGIDDPVWDVTVFTKNRDRLLDGDIAPEFFQAVPRQPRIKVLLSDEHFGVDGTPIEAWAGRKSFRPLIVDAVLTPATGTAEREAAEAMMSRQAGRHRATLGADKA